MDSAKSKKSVTILGCLLVLCGIILNSAGIIAIWESHGSEQSVAAAILLLIEAIVMYSITASHTESPRSQWIMSLVFRVAAVLLIIGAVICMIVDSFSVTAITAGILLLVEGIVIWAMGSGNNPFHSASSPIRAVPGMNKTVQELCDALGNTEADAHRITEIPDSNGICLGKETLPDAYVYMITRYLENGNPIWNTKLKKPKKKQYGLNCFHFQNHPYQKYGRK